MQRVGPAGAGEFHWISLRSWEAYFWVEEIDTTQDESMQASHDDWRKTG